MEVSPRLDSDPWDRSLWSDGDHNGYNAGSEPPAETWSWIREESSYSVTLSTSEGIATSGLHPGSSVGITAQVTRETWQLWQSNLGRSEARDRSLAPGYGASVDFSIGSGSGALSYGSMSANYAGTASTTLTVGTTDCQVIASVGFGGTRPSASLNLSVNQEWIYSGDGSKRIVTMAPDQDAPRTVVASVTLQTWKNGTRLGLSEMHDFAEVPALGAAVSFTCLQGGAWLQPQAGVTDRYGRVRCTYGSYHQSVIRADADFSGVTGSATITVPATDAPPDDPPEETWTDSHVDVSLSVTAASTGLSNDRKSMGLSASASCSRTLIQISNWGNTRSIPLPSDGRLSVAWSIASGDATISASATGSSATAQLGTQASVAEVSVSCDGQSGSATVELPPRPDEEEDEEEEEENPGGNSPPIYRLSLSPGGVRVFKPGDVLPTQATVSASTTDSSATRVVLRMEPGAGKLDNDSLSLTSGGASTTLRGLVPGRTVVEGKFYDTQGQHIGPVQQAELIILPVEFKKMWETKNKANQVFNSARKDDPKASITEPPDAAGSVHGVDTNHLYVVVDPTDNKLGVTVDVVVGSDPTKWVAAAFNGGSKVSGSDTVFPASGPVAMHIPHGDELAIRVGYDANGNSQLDTAEEIKLSMAAKFDKSTNGEPTVKGISGAKYTEMFNTASGVIALANVPLFPIPHSAAFLRLFRDGTTTGMPADKRPTSPTGSFTMDVFKGELSEWLTHNSGAAFTDDGIADTPFYHWDATTSAGELAGLSYTVKTAVQSHFDTAIMPHVTAHFASLPPGAQADLPQSGLATITHAHQSTPPWAPKTTVLFNNPYLYDKGLDDVFGTIGRGRVPQHKARYTVKKVEYDEYFGDNPTGSPIFRKAIGYNVTARTVGSVTDIYDFNYNAGTINIIGATLQLGYGKGIYGRTAGKIYRWNINWDETFDWFKK